MADKERTQKRRWMIEVEFDHEGEARRHYQEIERLLESMGETGTLSMRTVYIIGPADGK